MDDRNDDHQVIIDPKLMVEDDLGLLVDRDDDEDQFEINEVGPTNFDVLGCLLYFSFHESF